jgi:hypothetical protein
MGIAPNGDVLIARETHSHVEVLRAEDNHTTVLCRLGRSVGRFGPVHGFRWLAFNNDCSLIAGEEMNDNERLYPQVGSPIVVWNMKNPSNSPQKLSATPSRGTFAVFSPDSKYLAVALIERRTLPPPVYDEKEEKITAAAMVYNLKNTASFPIIFGGLKGDTTGITFSGNGAQLAVATESGDIALVQTDELHRSPLILHGNSYPIVALAFNEKDKLVSVTADGTVRSWLIDTEMLAEAVCSRVSRNLTEQEWAHFVGADIPYELTCPQLPSERLSDVLAASHTRV